MVAIQKGIKQVSCSGLTKTGKPCNGRAMQDSIDLGRPFCKYHNPLNADSRPVHTVKAALRQKQVANLLGKGLSIAEIADKCGVTPATIYDDVAQMAKYVRNSEAARDEAVMRLIRNKEELVALARKDLEDMRRRAHIIDKPTGKVYSDPKKYESLSAQIKTLSDTVESYERTLARLALVPPEPSRLDVTGSMHTRNETVNIIIEALPETNAPKPQLEVQRG